jgi:IS30 family transposase
LTPPSGFRLSLAEREEIACLTAAGRGPREIGRRIGRPASTISRELSRNTTSRQRGYRAWTAQAQAERAAHRPKERRLAKSLPLRQEVQARLAENHSPQQIATRLRLDFPDDPEMWVSHESIYQALYVQAVAACGGS